jgi:hypothetical protein
MQRFPRKESTITGSPVDALGVHKASATADATPNATPNATRRHVLQGMLATATASLLGSVSMLALAQTPMTSSDSALDAFMSLSKALTSRSALDSDVGARLMSAVSHGQAPFETALPKLAAGLSSGQLDADQQQLAWRIMEGWYLGTVDNVVITYEQALMFDVVSDTLVIRSYAPGKPGFWAQKPIEKTA